MSWFACRTVAPGVHLLAEPSHVNTWLVEGDDLAVLLDTGMGVAPIRPAAERLTRLPLEVVNTHSHWDHVGGNHEFDAIAIHELGGPWLATGPPTEVLDRYLDFTHRLLAATEEYRRLDAEFFHLLTSDSLPRPLPEGFSREGWAIAPSAPTRLLREGDRIDLGGRTLTVLHTPGHSPDSICLLDERAGILFGGDTINTGPIYAQLASSDVEDFARSTARLAELQAEISTVTVHHFGRVLAEPSLLGEVAEGFVRLAAGRAELVPAVDCLGRPVLEAGFDRFSIYVEQPAE